MSRGDHHAVAGATALAEEFGAAFVRAAREAAVVEQDRAGMGHCEIGGHRGGLSWYAFALQYMEMRWPLIAAKARDETNGALCAITLSMLRDVRSRPSDQLLRRAAGLGVRRAPPGAARDAGRYSAGAALVAGRLAAPVRRAGPGGDASCAPVSPARAGRPGGGGRDPAAQAQGPGQRAALRRRAAHAPR